MHREIKAHNKENMAAAAVMLAKYYPECPLLSGLWFRGAIQSAAGAQRQTLRKDRTGIAFEIGFSERKW